MNRTSNRSTEVIPSTAHAGPNAGAAEPPGSDGFSRRGFLKSTSVTAAGLSVAAAVEAQPGAVSGVASVAAPNVARSATQRKVTLRVNGYAHTIEIEARVTLLDALREVLALNGSKKGCDRGQCGACTVLVDGRRINSCLTLAVMHEGSAITTIEGLGTPESMHPMQAAFLAHDGFQCGYCTSGQICSAVALLDELNAQAPSSVSFERASEGSGATNARGAAANGAADPHAITITDAEIRERMSGNLCRCGAYSNIVAAVREVAEGRKA